MADKRDQGATSSAPLDLDAIRRRIPTCLAPWYVEYDEPAGKWLIGYPTANPLAGLIATVPDYGEQLAEFIAHARTDVPALVEQVAALAAELERVRAVVERIRDCHDDGREGVCCGQAYPCETVYHLDDMQPAAQPRPDA